MIKIAENDCINLQKSLGFEWLDTNGLGGYASSTILECHTRKYHGLLVARLAKPSGKYVLISKLEDALVQGSDELCLSAHQYPGVIYPRGHHFLSEFALDLTPTFKYRMGDMRVTKEIALLQGEDTVLVRYHVHKSRPGTFLRVKPLLAFRSFHDLSHENLFLRVRTFPVPDGFLISPYEGMPSLYMQVSGPFAFYPSPMWYRNFEYFREFERGFPHREDLFCPGVFELPLERGGAVVLSASTALQTGDLKEKWDEEIDRRRKARAKRRGSAMQKTLEQAADQFLVSTSDGGRSVVAGYPWFGEWGRDAMIALAGYATIATRREDCLAVLSTFAARQRRGIIPNFLGETPAEDAFNSADAALWFIHAVQRYVEAVRGHKAVAGPIWKAVKEAIRWYRQGTDFGIAMLPDGLLTVGSPELQVTWMDAMIGGVPVTPRCGCPVEINALWYNAICFARSLAAKLKDPLAKSLDGLPERIAESFNARFWSEEDQCLGDLYADGRLDRTIRPNQIFAVSLPFSPLPADRAEKVVARVKRELVTPRGLRTLSPADPAYVGYYSGPPEERDRAYHNGAVWPWLLGHYGEARLKTAADKAEAIAEMEELFTGFDVHLNKAGLGTVSEIFTGNPPHRTAGCIGQAWSVLELLRLTRLLDQARRSESLG